MDAHKENGCHVCKVPSFERNNYFYGKQFTVRDLVQEQCYVNEKRWLINRMILGWGVACGLKLEWREDCQEFSVDTGLAIDCCGRELLVCEKQYLPLDQYMKQCGPAHATPEGEYVICLEYFECKTEALYLPPLSCDHEERQEYNRLRDGFRFKIRRRSELRTTPPVAHTPCYEDLQRDIHLEGYKPSHTCPPDSMHQRLCEYLASACPSCEPHACVIVGTFTVKTKASQQYESGSGQTQGAQPQQPHQGKDASTQQQSTDKPKDHEELIQVTVDQSCGDRRLVYGNQLLYDLITCHHGDLPHINEFNWREHAHPKRELKWETFVHLMNQGLTVRFDQQMEQASLNKHTFIVSFLHEDHGTGSLIQKRIPAERVKYKTLEDGCVEATFVPESRWLRDELQEEGRSELYEGIDVEIILRGSHIRSAAGKALDGEFIFNKLPTGNGVQGGDFVDWFRVLKKGDKPKPSGYEGF